jgi:tRNA pseudouridine38-40 synthase
MDPSFHARFSATSRRYSYRVGTDAEARAPFRRRWEYAVLQPLNVAALNTAAREIIGEHCFVAFAVRGTAPATDNHRCRILSAEWRPVDGGLRFEVEANRFLHHMVRFLVGTMLDVATGRRPEADIDRLLHAGSNDDVSPPAPAHALCLERVEYPAQLYAQAA